MAAARYTPSFLPSPVDSDSAFKSCVLVIASLSAVSLRFPDVAIPRLLPSTAAHLLTASSVNLQDPTSNRLRQRAPSGHRRIPSPDGCANSMMGPATLGRPDRAAMEW